MKLISVVIPVYNVQKYLEECLDSVIGQTYKNIEILLIDDGSTDLSGKICDEYADKDFRIQVIHQKNSGLSGARNKGIDLSSGDYIMFLDSDDYLEKDMLEKLVTTIENLQCDIAVTGTIYCDENKNFLFEKSVKQQKIYHKNEQIFNLLTSYEIGTMAWGKLYNKNLFNDLRYPLNKYHEDVYLTYKLLDKSKKTVVIPDIGVHYRQIKTSIVHSKFSIKHLDSVEATKQRMEFIEKKYPEYRKYSYSTVVYACCKVFEKMVQSGYRNEKIETNIQKDVRKYLFYFLFYSKSRITTKLFCILLSFNTSLTNKFYKIFS